MSSRKTKLYERSERSVQNITESGYGHHLWKCSHHESFDSLSWDAETNTSLYFMKLITAGRVNANAPPVLSIL
jgi:hypothetical protein